jgi:hypothetical protein
MTEKKKNSKVQMLDEEDLDQVSGGAWTAEYSDEEYWDAGVMPVSFAGLWNHTYVLQTSGEELGWIEAGEAVIYKKYMDRRASSKAEIKRFMKNDWPRMSGVDSSGGYPNMHD